MFPFKLTTAVCVHQVCALVMISSCYNVIILCGFCGFIQFPPRFNKSRFTKLQELLWVAATCAWCRWQQGYLEEEGLMLLYFYTV